jgi:hypothetical protein
LFSRDLRYSVHDLLHAGVVQHGQQPDVCAPMTLAEAPIYVNVWASLIMAVLSLIVFVAAVYKPLLEEEDEDEEGEP